jgi:predicted site-specific integrase-resolvase
MHPVYLNSSEVARLIKVSPLTLYRWRKSGKGPPCTKIAARYLYDQAAVIRWIEQQPGYQPKADRETAP